MNRIALAICVALVSATFSVREANAQTPAGYCAIAAQHYSDAAEEAYNAYSIAKNQTAKNELLAAYNQLSDASDAMYDAYQHAASAIPDWDAVDQDISNALTWSKDARTNINDALAIATGSSVQYYGGLAFTYAGEGNQAAKSAQQ